MRFWILAAAILAAGWLARPAEEEPTEPDLPTVARQSGAV